MVHLPRFLGLVLSAAAVLVSGTPLPTAAPDINNAVALQKRAGRTFANAAAASKSKNSCATIVLDSIAVLSGVTLDLTGLNAGTHVSILHSLSEHC